MNDELSKQAAVHGFTVERSIGHTFPINRGSVCVGHIFATPSGWFALARRATQTSPLGDSVSALKHLAEAK